MVYVHTVTKRTLESLVRPGEILGAERSQILPHMFLASATPPCRKVTKIPSTGQLLAVRNTQLSLGAEAMHVRTFRCMCSEGIHAAAKLLSILVGDTVYSSQSLKKLQLYQHHKMPVFHGFSQSN